MTGADFHVLRDGELVATVTDSTDYLDAAGTATSSYTGPIAQQLDNALRQADRHAQDGRARAATGALDRAMDRLEEPRRTDQVSDDARAALAHQVRTLLDMLS